MALYFGFEVFTAVTLKSTVFWHVTPYSPVEVYGRFGEHMPPSSSGGCLFKDILVHVYKL
jgi:hypothetical protein